MTDLRVRLVKGPLNDWGLPDLRRKVRTSAVDMLRFSGAACDMLTSLAGVRLGSSLRAVLWPYLMEIVSGELPSGDGEYTDVMTGAFGQMLGPVFAVLCEDSGGEWEIIRVLEEPANESRPDFILVNRSNGSITIHECKGVMTDADKAEDRDELDVCKNINSQYGKGRDKLLGPLRPDCWKVERRLTILGDGQVLPFPTDKLLVSVAAISDGRLGRLKPPPKHASGCGLPCTQQCVADGTNGIIIGALAEKVLVDAEETGQPDDRRFPILDAYKACERALWQGSGAALGSAYASLLAATRQAEYDDDAITHSADFLISPLEAAAAQGVAVDMREALRLADTSRLPESFVAALQYWQGRQPSERHEPPSEVDVSELGQMLRRHGEDQQSNARGREWVLRDSRERHVHLCLADTPTGRLARLSPREALSSPADGANPMLKIAAEFLSATLDVPIDKEWFTPQQVSLVPAETSADSGEVSSFHLGWSLSPWQDGRLGMDMLHWHLRHGMWPAPWDRCPHYPGLLRELWREFMHECLHCRHCAPGLWWWPWFPFRAWVSYDGRAEIWLP